MKILNIKSLAIEDIKVVSFGRFSDVRGYFTETYKKSDFLENLGDVFGQSPEFVQNNESFSRTGTIRGLHFQWNPYMGKLVRTVQGRMVDIALDIRKNSPTAGKIIMYDMPSSPDSEQGEWIWVPPGFAHGNFFTEDTTIEYCCTGEYSPGCEAGISPYSDDLDWSLCDNGLKTEFKYMVQKNALITDKDRDGLSFQQWQSDKRSQNFIYGSC